MSHTIEDTEDIEEIIDVKKQYWRFPENVTENHLKKKCVQGSYNFSVDAHRRNDSAKVYFFRRTYLMHARSENRYIVFQISFVIFGVHHRVGHFVENARFITYVTETRVASRTQCAAVTIAVEGTQNTVQCLFPSTSTRAVISLISLPSINGAEQQSMKIANVFENNSGAEFIRTPKPKPIFYTDTFLSVWFLVNIFFLLWWCLSLRRKNTSRYKYALTRKHKKFL